MNKIKLTAILFITAFFLVSCGKTTETPEAENDTTEEVTLDTPMLKIEDNILSFTDKFTFEGISTGSRLAVIIENASKTWKYTREYAYYPEFSLNIDNEIIGHILRGTMKMPVEEKITVAIFKSDFTWICESQYNYKPKTERIAAFDYGKRNFTPRNMTFTEESAWTASEKMKNGANIANNLDCVVDGLYGIDIPPVAWESAWYASPVTLENIRYLKSLGFNAIRLPVSWGQHLDSNDKVFDSWMNRVQEIVDWCMDEDLYVIINTHHDGGANKNIEGSSWIHTTEESYNAGKDLYAKILNQICERFKNYSEKLIFANANEVIPGDNMPSNPSEVEDSNFPIMEKWNQLFVDTVRNSGGNNAKRNISVSSILTDYGEEYLSRIHLPNDSAEGHLLFEVHCYDPWFFCGQGAGCTITKFDESGFDINHALVPSFEFSQKYDIPVFIGEWNVFDDSETGKYIEDEDRAEYAKQFISYATKHGITPFIWGPCEYLGFTSKNDALHYCPKFLKAIQDNIVPSEYKHATIKEHSISLKKDYIWDTTANAPSTTEYDNIGAKLDLTKSFNQLPVEGNTISVSCDLVSNKNISDLYFYFVDTTSETNNYWLKLDGGFEKQGHIQNIQIGTDFSLSYNPTLTTSPEGNITLWIYYPKTVLDEEIILSVK